MLAAACVGLRKSRIVKHLECAGVSTCPAGKSSSFVARALGNAKLALSLDSACATGSARGDITALALFAGARCRK